jgi:hypothetical protein
MRRGHERHDVLLATATKPFRCIALQQRNPEIAVGRPTIGKLAMTSTERSRRYRAGLAAKPAATKPAEPATKRSPSPGSATTLYDVLSGYTEAVTRPELIAENAQLKARIAELEQERDHYNQEIARLQACIAKLEALPATKPATAAPERIKLSIEHYKTLVRRIHPDNWAYLKDETLTKALTEAFQVLEELFEPVKQDTERTRKRPVDWSAVELIVKTYAEGKTRVTTNGILRAIYARMPTLKEDADWGQTISYARRILRSLDFRRSLTGDSFERAAAKAAAVS